MHNHQLPTDIKSISFDKVIWGMAVDDNTLILDVRDELSKEVSLIKLHLNEWLAEEMSIDLSWWERLVGAQNSYVYLVSYNKQNDPSDFRYFKMQLLTGERSECRELPAFDEQVAEPELYEHNTEHHQTVASFLSIELPLSCEYLEWNDNIIISYYLRSENGFDRFLLCLKNGGKVWEVEQDRDMKGFSSGAFFVHNDQLIFTKDRNEVCVYPL